MPIDEDLADAKAQARALFRALPDSPERHSVLSALGRVGLFSLPRKVRHRSEIVSNQLPDQFPNLDMVTDAAIAVRNLFIHGHNRVLLKDDDRRAELTDEQIDEHYLFFTRTLEFIFAASDLADSGWDISVWFPKIQTGAHPFRQFVNAYDGELAKLKELLPDVVDAEPDRQ